MQNILEKSGAATAGDINPDHFNVAVEAQLSNCIASIQAVKSEPIDARLAEVANSAETIESYFEEVMVMDDNLTIRENRLNTLRQLSQALTAIAAFNLLQ